MFGAFAVPLFLDRDGVGCSVEVVRPQGCRSQLCAQAEARQPVVVPQGHGGDVDADRDDNQPAKDFESGAQHRFESPEKPEQDDDGRLCHPSKEPDLTAEHHERDAELPQCEQVVRARGAQVFRHDVLELVSGLRGQPHVEQPVGNVVVRPDERLYAARSTGHGVSLSLKELQWG